jgi:hypothetical protein
MVGVVTPIAAWQNFYGQLLRARFAAESGR